MKNCCNNIAAVSVSAIVVMLAGCAGGMKKETAAFGPSNPLAVIQVTKKASTGADCPATVKITNRTGGNWDGVSYHLALHNRSGVSIGKLLGSPHKPVKAGGDLLDNGQVLGAKCEDLTGVALVYFGYYPAGKQEVHAHVNSVRVEFR